MRRIAYIHDRLVYIGWADKVFFQLINEELTKSPIQESKIFTLVSTTKSKTINWKEIKIITALPSIINALFIKKTKASNNLYHKIYSKIFDYRNLIVFYPILMKLLERKIKKYNPHLAVISSANISKNISFPKQSYTKLYLHSPLMYIQPEFKTFYSNFNILTRIIFKIISPLLSIRDKSYTKFDEVRANSFHTARLAKSLYNIDASVAYPLIDKNELYWKAKPSNFQKNYYIYVWRLVKNLRDVDKIIKLFNTNWEKLIIIWDWPDWDKLKSIAHDNIKFMWYIHDKEKIINLVKKSQWYINLAYESSWMSTVEALLLWVPIFGYNKWWTAELVDKNSWLLINQKDEETIINQFKSFQKMRFDRFLIKKNIQKKINKNAWKHINQWK